ncbi:serine hydrolase domain-containing protein [Brachybacterium saurashtrense]|uniref:Class A beta-lactamase-related serine hydrolase n=1 Tax=Brachybacterium saurashtrense TaxID=556288 RepID=A0A345YSK9_9MICO|nr:serine hydrolase domain-containing protein [Brachybacterium saurashtrense]AXK46911.1 class A beta-lactamase-related serine hydrolase [Brachybacterium saurashtrense]RRR22626.1 class A beta-lactamase-related serine hydrolase [Brachybacterium saurashtrense]
MPETSAHSPVIPPAVLASVAALFETAVAEHRTAGITWAVIGGHAHEQAVLGHGAAGHRALRDGAPAEGAAPMDRATVSRIASMTKSFTAATVLALRDEGRLRLDDPVSAHVPEAAGAFDLAGDEREPTLRQLLTMSAGLVTDNPWGDRQEAMTREEFAATLRGGLSHVHRVGTGFEYSNTGYALLGRVIDEVTGGDYTREIHRRFLAPLGLEDTGWSAEEIDTARLATGHRLADRTDATRFEQVPLDSPGVYGAMAGLFSTVDDVARWVRFLAAADAPDTADRPQGPLATASRREMQQLHRHQPLAALPVDPEDPAGTSPGFDRVRGYGLGLVVEHFPDLGEVISHSGGYPGYGSFMVWHRDSGVGVVALANSKYAPATPLSMQALRLLQREVPGLLARRGPEAAPRTLAAADAALSWLAREDDAVADAWFADSMELDVSRPERRRRLAAALRTAGLERSDLAQLEAGRAEVLSPARLRWTVPGRGAGAPNLRIELLMDPRREAAIQSLDTLAVTAG